MSPRVSILLPVYNVAQYIEATIDSILKQTFTDFELLILDDCSTDETAIKIKSINDPRIKFIQNPHNLGRAGTDNAGLQHARGEYIAKMDGDDICHRERLAKQVNLLDQRPDVNVVGSWMQNFGASNYLNRYPEQPTAAQVLTLFTLPTGNPSVMLRASLFRELGMQYDAALRQTEDYDFFARYICELRIFNLQQALINYRVPPDVRKKDILSERAFVSDEVRERLLSSWGVPFTARELQVHNTIAMLERPNSNVTLAEVDAWLRKLLQYNQEQPLFESSALRRGLGERWFEVCYTYRQFRLRDMQTYYRSPLASDFPLSGKRILKFWLQTLRRF